MGAIKRTTESVGSKLLLSVVGCILFSLLCYLPNANAFSYSQFEVVSGTINYVDLGGGSNYTVWVSTDADKDTTGNNLQVTGFSYYGATGFAHLTTTYPASPTTLTNSLDQQLDLASDNKYYFYLMDSNGNLVDYTITETDYATYEIKVGNDVIIQIDAVASVPIPPSALLLGSGVIGLIGFGVRRRRANVS